MSIDGKVIYSGEMVCEGNYLFQINFNYRYYVLQRTKSINTIIYLMTIINSNVNVICYDLADVLPLCLRCLSQNFYNTLLTLHIPMKEHDIIMDENN